VTPPIADPLPDNNSTRFRFAIGFAYSYTLIFDITGNHLIRGVDINESGQVAFGVNTYNNGDLIDFGVFVGDGNTLSERLAATDLPPVSAPLKNRFGNYGCISFNDAGWITLLTDVWDSDIPNRVDKRTASSVYLIDPGGNLTLLDTSSYANDGVDWRLYSQTVINNRNRVLATYYRPRQAPIGGIAQFEAGQRTDIYHSDYYLDQLGLNDNNDYVFGEKQGSFFPVDNLMLHQQTPSGLFIQNLAQYTNRIDPGDLISLNDFRQAVFTQKYAGNGANFEALFGGGSRPLLSWTALDLDLNFGERHAWSPAINNKGRYVFTGQVPHNGAGGRGIFTGPDYLAHAVARYGQPMLGAIFTSSGSRCSVDINEAGQVAFEATLQDSAYNYHDVVVRADPTEDNDGDGILDWDELNAPNYGDGNGDGIPDSVQPEVASVPNQVDGRTATFATDPNFTLTNVRAVSNPSPGNAPNGTFPLGHFAFDLAEMPPGGSATVTVTLPGGGMNSWWKYGRTPDNTTPHWYEFTFDGTTGAETNGNVVTLHFVDGARGDDDLTANGTISDPGGPIGFEFATYLPVIQK
jgi:hypothetical protein